MKNNKRFLALLVAISVVASLTILFTLPASSEDAPVWEPNLVGATNVAPTGRNYVADANGNNLGFVTSSSTSAGAAISFLADGTMRFENTHTSSGLRLNVVVAGTGTGGSSAEGYGFAPEEGGSYRIEVRARDADLNPVEALDFYDYAGDAPHRVSGTRKDGTDDVYYYEFTYNESERTHASANDSGHGIMAVGIVSGESGIVRHYSDIKIYETEIIIPPEEPWVPNLVGATNDTPTARNYIKDATGEYLGFLVGTSTADGPVLSIDGDKLVYNNYRSGNMPLRIVTGGNGWSETAGFSPRNGSTYKLTFTATDASGSVPGNFTFSTTGQASARDELPAEPISGTNNFERIIEWPNGATADGSHGIAVIGMCLELDETVIFSNFRIEPYDASITTEPPETTEPPVLDYAPVQIMARTNSIIKGETVNISENGPGTITITNNAIGAGAAFRGIAIRSQGASAGTSWDSTGTSVAVPENFMDATITIDSVTISGGDFDGPVDMTNAENIELVSKGDWGTEEEPQDNPFKNRVNVPLWNAYHVDDNRFVPLPPLEEQAFDGGGNMGLVFPAGTTTITINYTVSGIAEIAQTTTPEATTTPVSTDDEPPTTTTTSEQPAFKLGRITPESVAEDKVTIFDALEILKALVGMDSLAKDNPAALITADSQIKGEPSIFDALEVLKKLVGMDNLIDTPVNPPATSGEPTNETSAPEETDDEPADTTSAPEETDEPTPPEPTE